MRHALRRLNDPRAAFVAVAVLAWATMPIKTSIRWTSYDVSAVLLIAALLIFVVLRSRPSAAVVAGSLVSLAALALLRASAGGLRSGVGSVALLPVFYAALYSRSRRVLIAVLSGMVAFYLVPIVVIGGSEYPNSQYRSTLLSVAASSIIGLVTQKLVAAARREADDSGQTRRMLERVATLVRELYENPEPRTELCRAARSIGGASAAVLYEPDASGSRLVCTATSGIDAMPGEVSAAVSSVVHDVFRARSPMMVSERVMSYVGSVELWNAAGSPQSLLYQPLCADDNALAVLAIGWPEQLDPNDPRVVSSARLADEASAVLARANEMQSLSDEALTDPLTGLPNRRAWDEALHEALEEDTPVTVVLFDLDHFKEFNDTHGHPAGDRLLRATAAAWRDQLRVGDFLARIGGEEFGLLLRSDTSVATEVVERLRGRVTDGRTCSAGIASRAPGEPGADIVARADSALYLAKDAGRDRAEISSVLDDPMRDCFTVNYKSSPRGGERL